MLPEEYAVMIPIEDRPKPGEKPATPEGQKWYREFRRQKLLTAGGIVFGFGYGLGLLECHTTLEFITFTVFIGGIPITLLWQAMRD